MKMINLLFCLSSLLINWSKVRILDGPPIHLEVIQPLTSTFPFRKTRKNRPNLQRSLRLNATNAANNAGGAP